MRADAVTIEIEEAPPRRTTRMVAGGGALLTGAMVVSGIGNYAINALYARWLTPSEFGDASLLVTLLLAVTAAAGCFQLVMARCVAGATDAEVVAATRARLVRSAWISGGLAATAIAVLSPQIADAFKVESAVALAIFGCGIPLHLSQAVDRGVLQGRLAFRRLAMSFLVEMAARLIVSVALVAAGFGLLGVSIALWSSLLAALVAARWAVGPMPTVATARPAQLRSVVGATTVLLVAQIVISHGDLLLVKQRFSPADAGTYAVVALLGRAVFTISWSVVTATFPAGAQLANDPKALRSVIRGGIGVLAAGGAIAIAGSWLLADRVIAVLFTDVYAGAAPLLGPYVLATVLLTLANFLAMIDLARGCHRRTALLVAGAVVQTTLILVSDTLVGVVWAQVAAMAATLALMTVSGSGRQSRADVA